MYNQKYIITKDNAIIVFSAALEHSDFMNFKPISAGFIKFGVNEQGKPSCYCYGKSISLGLESRPEDTSIAQFELDMLDDY